MRLYNKLHAQVRANYEERCQKNAHNKGCYDYNSECLLQEFATVDVY